MDTSSSFRSSADGASGGEKLTEKVRLTAYSRRAG